MFLLQEALERLLVKNAVAHNIVSARCEGLNLFDSSVLRHDIGQDPAVLDEHLSSLVNLMDFWEQ